MPGNAAVVMYKSLLSAIITVKQSYHMHLKMLNILLARSSRYVL